MKTKFTNLRTTKKGKVGEQIIKRMLKAKKLFVYEPDGPHPFDFICSMTGKYFFAVEVKTYPRLHTKPFTGIDKADWIGYKGALQRTGTDCVLFFVDEFEEMIYQRKVSDLIPFAQVQRNKVLFPLGAFKIERKLTDDELKRIRSNNTISINKYRQTNKFFVPGWKQLSTPTPHLIGTT